MVTVLKDPRGNVGMCVKQFLKTKNLPYTDEN